MTTLRTSRVVLILAIAQTVAGCASGDLEAESDWDDGKADLFGGSGNCLSGTEMIAAARVQLVRDEPDFFTSDSFSDETAFVESMGDLNGDGAVDAIVFPGLSYSGDNSEQVVYLSAADGCATTYAGHFSAASVVPTEDGAVTNSVRDLTVVNRDGCDAIISRYTFDGQRYTEASHGVENLCGGQQDCLSDVDMIAAARAQLVQDEPDFFASDSFGDETAFVEIIADLNGDGVDDAIVFPGLSYSGDNSEQVVYLSDAQGCVTVYAGHFGASSVVPAEDGAVTNGVRDLTVVNRDGCDAIISRYTFDGVHYNEASHEIENLC